jgi:hypothetical protein
MFMAYRFAFLMSKLFKVSVFSKIIENKINEKVNTEAYTIISALSEI